MSSLLTDVEKAAAEAAIRDVADTFARPLVIIRQANEVVISNNPNHTSIFDRTPFNSTTQVTPVTGVFMGRIGYEHEQPLGFMLGIKERQGGDQVNVTQNQGIVRVKLDPSGASFINGAQRVQFDGNTFTIDSAPRPHGLFTPQYYTFNLKRTN